MVEELRAMKRAVIAWVVAIPLFVLALEVNPWLAYYVFIPLTVVAIIMATLLTFESLGRAGDRETQDEHKPTT